MSFQIQNVRVTFPNIFEAKQVQGQGEAKFSITGLLGKDHPQLGEIKTCISDTAKAKWGEAMVSVKDTNGDVIKLPNYQAVLKQLQAADKICLHDGDAKSDYEGYAGNYFLNASNKIRPLVVGGGADGRAPLTAADGKIYSGCYCNIIVDFWAQDNQFGKRVNASIMGVQFVKDGDRLAGGGVAAADDFAPIPQETVAKAEASGGGASALF